MGNHTPGPWKACHDGKCRCKQVWSAHHPVADVIHGPWGDPYPALEISGGAIDMTAKPVMRMIEYGTVPDDIAEANARLIAAAPELLEALSHIVRLMEPMEREGGINVPGLATLNGARAAIARANGEGEDDSESAE